MMCRNACTECGTARCNPENGECVAEESQILFDWSDNVPTNIMRLSNDRIKAKQWIQMNGNGKIVMKNCTILEGVACNPPVASKGNGSAALSNGDAHLANLIGETHLHHVLIQKNNTLLMNALNSSIANLTNDIGKLSKQVTAQHIEQRSRAAEMSDSQLPKMAIILEPQAIISTTSLDGEVVKIRSPEDSNVEKAERLVVRESSILKGQKEAMVNDKEKQVTIVQTSNGGTYVQSIGGDGVINKQLSNMDDESERTDNNIDAGVQQREEVLHILTLQTNNQTESVSTSGINGLSFS